MAASSRHPPQPQRLSSFVMLAHMVASPRGITPSSLGCTPESLLANTLDVVRRGLAHPVDKLAEDEALFWLWWCVEQQLELEEPLSKDVLFNLADVRLPLLSRSAAHSQADHAPGPIRRSSPHSRRSLPTLKHASSRSASSDGSSRPPMATPSRARRRRSACSGSSSSTVRRRACALRVSDSSRSCS